jgi:TrmH family RNA methyltransferase
MIHIVLVEPTHPGNIGAAARAMKTMGLDRLVLVAPRSFPHPLATAQATYATDILQQAVVVPSFEEAIASMQRIYATTARPRSLPWPSLTPAAMATDIATLPPAARVAIVFGRERTGLANTELDRCHATCTIPTATPAASLNLAQAVQLIAYEWHIHHAHAQAMQPPRRRTQLPTQHDLEQLCAHTERLMHATGFLDPEKPRRLMRRLRRLMAKAQPDLNEVNILRGLLRSVEDHLTPLPEAQPPACSGAPEPPRQLPHPPLHNNPGE